MNRRVWLVKRLILPLICFLSCLYIPILTMCVCTHLVCVLAHSPLCVCTFPLSSLQSWQLLSPKLPCGLCFISSSLQDLLSTSLLCSQLLSTPTKVRPPRCLSPSAPQTKFFFFLKGSCSPQINCVNRLRCFQIDFVEKQRTVFQWASCPWK